MSDASPLLTLSTPGSTDRLTIGSLLPGTLAVVVDPEAGDELPSGARGELFIKRSQVTNH